MSIIDELIIARTEPGKYDWQDFNRVGEAVAYVTQRLREAGYTADVVTKTDWTRQSIQSRQDMERYIANIQALRNILAFPPETPAAPDTIRFLTYQKANDIEEIVQTIDILIDSLTRVYLRSAQTLLFSGFAVYMPEQAKPLYTSTGQQFLTADGAKVYVR